MKTLLPLVVVGVFASGVWSGYAAFYALNYGPFGYDPCWPNLIDVRQEADYQNSLGPQGWKFDKPNLKNDCVLVDPKWRYKGYREMTSNERALYGR